MSDLTISRIIKATRIKAFITFECTMRVLRHNELKHCSIEYDSKITSQRSLHMESSHARTEKDVKAQEKLGERILSFVI